MTKWFSPQRWYARLRRHYTARAATVSPTAAICVETSQIAQTVSERYLSFSIDISVLAGGFWWEGSGRAQRGLGALRVPPVKLRGNRLDKLVRALGAVLSAGGRL